MWHECYILSVVIIGILGKRPLPSDIPDDWRKYIDPVILKEQLNDRSSTIYANGSFEGDIQGIDRDMDLSLGGMGSDFVMNERLLWPDGLVPYRISEELEPEEKEAIAVALNNVTQETRGCIRFVERSDESDFVFFLKYHMCGSFVGRQGGRQNIYYTPSCLRHLGQIIHEVMHALGCYHEMSRMDRDDYIKIVCSNIDRSDWKQFVSYRGDMQGLPYDYESLMHYPFNAFGIDTTLPTIIPKKINAKIGQRNRMSALDVVRIKLGYKCPLDAGEKMLVKGPTNSDQFREPSSCNKGHRAMPV